MKLFSPPVAVLRTWKSSVKYATSLQDYKIQASVLPTGLAIWQYKFYKITRVSSTDIKRLLKIEYQLRRMEIRKSIIAGSGN